MFFLAIKQKSLPCLQMHTKIQIVKLGGVGLQVGSGAIRKGFQNLSIAKK